MNDIRVWVDGRVVSSAAPAVSALDHGLTVGDGAFETCKVEDGEVFAMSRHLARLDRTVAGLGLHPVSHDRIREGVAAVLDEGEPIGFGRLRFTVTAGVGPAGSDRAEIVPTYIVSAVPVELPPASCAVVTVPWTRNERAATAGLKTTSYADNVLALAYAKERGGLEAVFANTRGELCEATGSNVFVVVDGIILTPPLDSGCLAGVTRGLVVEWCHEVGLTLREEALPLDVLTRCDEVFITSSTKDVMPVHDVDGRRLDVPGPVTRRVRELFTRLSAERREP